MYQASSGSNMTRPKGLVLHLWAFVRLCSFEHLRLRVNHRATVKSERSHITFGWPGGPEKLNMSDSQIYVGIFIFKYNPACLITMKIMRHIGISAIAE